MLFDPAGVVVHNRIHRPAGGGRGLFIFDPSGVRFPFIKIGPHDRPVGGDGETPSLTILFHFSA